MREKIFATIKENLPEIYREFEIVEETNLIRDMDFDSVSLMQLIIELETTFEIDFDDDVDVEEIMIVHNLIDYIERKIAEK